MKNGWRTSTYSCNDNNNNNNKKSYVAKHAHMSTTSTDFTPKTSSWMKKKNLARNKENEVPVHAQ